jgi:DNA-binding CsgD family transcriptional regulator
MSAGCVQRIVARETGVGRRWTVACTPLPAGADAPAEVLLHFELDEAGTEGTGPGPAPSQRPRMPTHLTPRERQVLDGLARGLDARELAQRLHLSEHTVRGHIKAVLQKLHAHSQLQAVLEGIRVGAVTGVFDGLPADRPRVGVDSTPD